MAVLLIHVYMVDAYARNALLKALPTHLGGDLQARTVVNGLCVGPSKKGTRPQNEMQGTGGTSAIKFVKAVRDQTAGAIIVSTKSQATS